MAAVMTEYISSIKFSLNFEDHKNSVQVQAGDSVFFDGVSQVKYLKKDGSEVSGKAPSLQSAIGMRWLAPKSSLPEGFPKTEDIQEAQKAVDRDADKIPVNRESRYDNLKGGSFEEMLAKERASDTIIREDDLIVKHTKPYAVAEKKAAAAGEKLEVAGDQVEVKENVMVNSSTTVTPTRTHKREIIRSEDYGAESTSPVKFKTAGSKGDKKKSGFTVDNTTPNLPEGATMDEVKRVTKVIKQDAESQGAKVVKTVKKASVDVETVDGINMKKTGTESGSSKIVEEEGISFRAASTRAGKAESGATVSSGGTPISEVHAGMDGVTVVQKRTGVNIPPKEQPNYLSMLPDDWGILHWTKKEKFIKVITDVGLLKFILTVETLQAVQNACKARLEELDNQAKSD